MQRIENIQQSLAEDFSLLENWEDKYELIIQLGKELPVIKSEYKTEENLIRGCQSRVWLHAEYNAGHIQLTADSDAIITKGLISLIVMVFNNQKPEDILNADLHFIQDIGLQEHLSPTRANGLLSMIKQIKLYAFVFAGSKEVKKEEGAENDKNTIT